MCMSVCVVADYLKINCKDLYDEIYNRGYKDGFNVDKSEERNKAIDDFFDELQNYEDNDDWLRLKMSSIYEIAEQLKEGGVE